MNTIQDVDAEYVGQGRSAVVYLAHDDEGLPLARKIFTGDSASKLVLFILTGSANPYTWCEAAIRTAVTRRHILTQLVRVWFGDQLRLPRTDGCSWNTRHQAFEIRAELIDGRHAPLRTPEKVAETDYLDNLVTGIMKPLQARLAESGFDGLVWQAGRGNPVASNNFMLENTGGKSLKWVWIDLESGVPALFALNPLATLGFYLPKSIHHRRWLFDDVDIQKLRAYLDGHVDQITRVIGDSACASLLDYVEDLDQSQNDWRSLRRYQRGIGYEQSRGCLTEEQARWYGIRPLRWYAVSSIVFTKRGARHLLDKTRQLWMWIKAFPIRRMLYRLLRYLISSRFRWGVARWFIGNSIRSWTRRGFLDKSSVDLLGHELREDEASAYLTDFSVHLAIKPFVKGFQWGILPALWLSGLINEMVFGLLLVGGGPIGRTAYTSGRMAQATWMRMRKPWVALVVGVLPVVGNMAYPLQLVYSSTENTGALARFIVYDLAARIGRAVPIWGGADSRVEHFFNRWCDSVVRWMMRLKSGKL
jgi:hypothetical protein